MAVSEAGAAESSNLGLIAALRRFGSAFMATLHSRVELLGYEFQRERMRVTRLLLLGMAALFFLVLGAFALTVFLIVLFWQDRVLATGIITLVYFGIAAAIGLFAKGEASRAAHPFAGTVEQLRKDREQFRRH